MTAISITVELAVRLKKMQLAAIYISDIITVDANSLMQSVPSVIALPRTSHQVPPTCKLRFIACGPIGEVGRGLPVAPTVPGTPFDLLQGR